MLKATYKGGSDRQETIKRDDVPEKKKKERGDTYRHMMNMKEEMEKLKKGYCTYRAQQDLLTSHHSFFHTPIVLVQFEWQGL